MKVDSAQEILHAPGNHVVVWLRRGTLVDEARRAVQGLRTVGRLPFVSNVYTTRDGGDDVIPLDRMIVRFRPGVTRRQVEELSAAIGSTVIRPPMPDSGLPEYLLSYPADRDPLEVASSLYRHPLVQWVDPDKISNRFPTGSAPDPYYSNQYYLNNDRWRNGIRVDVNIERAWDLTKGSPWINVVVIDDGVDASHADFDGLRLTKGLDQLARYAQGDGPWAPYPTDRHGTAVAGIIIANHNSLGTAGVAPDVSLTVARIFRRCDGFRCSQVATDQQIGDAIRWAWCNSSLWCAEADVINNSWTGGAPSDHITSAINDGTTQGRDGLGTAIVFAAGNTWHGPVKYPATLPTVIAVSALGRDGELTAYSAVGPEIDIAAFGGHYDPVACNGADIFTTDLWGGPGCNDGPGGDQHVTSTFSGTSAAAPQVSGVIALLLSRERGLSWESVKRRVLGNADPWGSYAYFGWGKLNAYYTLVPRVTVSISGPTLIQSEGDYVWQAATSGGNGIYSYQWSVYWYANGNTDMLGTDQTQVLHVGPSGDFRMQVAVTSDGVESNNFLEVRNQVGGGGGLEFRQRPGRITQPIGSHTATPRAAARVPLKHPVAGPR